jgi:hypothetical protein
MTAKEALNQIKALFADANVPEAPSAPATEQFKEYQLANGSTVMIDNLAVGGMVTVPGPEGNPIPAPVGDHILADGQVITLDEAGKITEIATPEVVEEVEDEMKKKIEAMESAIADIKADYSARFDAQADEFAAKTKAAEDKLTALKDVLVEFLSAPSADPIKPEQFRESKSDKVNRFLEFTKNMK